MTNNGEDAPQDWAIVVHPFLQPMMRSAFKLHGLRGGVIQDVMHAIESGKPLRINEGDDKPVHLVPLGRDAFVRVMSWKAFEEEQRQQQAALQRAQLAQPLIVPRGRQ